MREITQAKRFNYDGDYERAIAVLCNIVEKQEKRIRELEEKFEGKESGDTES